MQRSGELEYDCNQAEKGKGAYLNGDRIFVSGADNINNYIVDVANWADGEYYMPRLYEKMEEAGAIATHYASIFYSDALVACGEFVGTVIVAETAWDVAPAKIIVEEAGGKVTDLWGNDQRYDQPIKGAVVSNGRVHDQILDIIKSCREEK